MPLLILFILFLPQFITPDDFPFFIVWNVGQGTTTTQVQPNSCLHIDAGGETFPTLLHKHCQNKKNQIFLTHFDKDHINFIKKMKQNWPQLCLGTKPPPQLTKWKKNLLSQIPNCPTPPSTLKILGTPNFKKRNESYAYLINNTLLITGDASSAQEKQILHLIKDKSKIQTLLAGHHGSRTSTGNFLLKNLPNLKQALISARKKKYGHPHKEVIQRLKTHQVPWIATETHGHIHLQSN